MLRDDPETVALVAAMCGRHRQIDSDLPPGRLHYRFWPTVDETAAVTGRSWATFHDGDILTPIPITPATPDRLSDALSGRRGARVPIDENRPEYV